MSSLGAKYYRSVPVLLAIALLTTSCIPGRYKLKVHKQTKTNPASGSVDVTLVKDADLAFINDGVTFTARFSEEPSLVEQNQFIVSNATITSLSLTGTQAKVSLSPRTAGDVKISIPAGVLQFRSGASNKASNELSWIYDPQKPSFNFVALDRSLPDFSSDAHAGFKVKSSEEADITLYSDESCTTAISDPKRVTAGTEVSIPANKLDVVFHGMVYAKAIDLAANESACAELRTYTHILKLVDPNPSANNGFGLETFVLSNGNILVSSHLADIGGITDAGAVYMFDGKTGILMSTMVGSSTNDQVGGGFIELKNGNFLIRSPNWSCTTTAGCSVNASAVGAITFVKANEPLPATINFSNSLVGYTASDQIGNSAIALSNGHYVIHSTSWDCNTANGCVANTVDVGATTWGNGSTGITGYVTPSNSLIGSSASDGLQTTLLEVGSSNYIVRRRYWDCTIALGCAANAIDVGAVTWANGSSGLTGVVNFSNSLVGSTADDQIGHILKVLSNGHFVVGTSTWDCAIARGCAANTSNVGAVTWGSGASGITGYVDISNSLIGTTASDSVGINVVPLSNGSYVIRSDYWDCLIARGCAANVTNAGASTWANGNGGTVGYVSFSNSLVGTSGEDRIGIFSKALTNGDYLVASPSWDCLTTRGCSSDYIDAGAVTLSNGNGGTTGYVGAANSIVGASAGDQLGWNSGIFPSKNGTFFLLASLFDCLISLGCPSNMVDSGIASWFSSAASAVGTISLSTSVFGETNEAVGNTLGTSFSLDDGTGAILGSFNCTVAKGCSINASNVGSVTWMKGDGSTTGQVSISNSLVGYSLNDGIGGYGSALKLSNGNYVMTSPFWNCVTALGCNANATDAGALTVVGSDFYPTGYLSSSNSLVASSTNDRLGDLAAISALPNGDFVIRSEQWGPSDQTIYLIVPGQPGVSGIIPVHP